MPKVLGVDYGRKKIGLATATSTLAEAYRVIRSESIKEAVNKIKKIVEEEEIGKVVIGISEGEMAEETKRFAGELAKELEVEIVFQDETLSTKVAQDLSIEANVPKKKRKEMEDAFAAAIILQSYLDSF